MYLRIDYAQATKYQLDLWRKSLQQAGCGIIYEEAASGKSAAQSALKIQVKGVARRHGISRITLHKHLGIIALEHP